MTSYCTGETRVGSRDALAAAAGARGVVSGDRPHQRARREANQPAQRQVGARDKAWFALDSPPEGDGLKFFLFINRIDWQTVLQTPLDIKGFFGTLANLA